MVAGGKDRTPRKVSWGGSWHVHGVGVGQVFWGAQQAEREREAGRACKDREGNRKLSRNPAE